MGDSSATLEELSPIDIVINDIAIQEQNDSDTQYSDEHLKLTRRYNNGVALGWKVGGIFNDWKRKEHENQDKILDQIERLPEGVVKDTIWESESIREVLRLKAMMWIQAYNIPEKTGDRLIRRGRVRAAHPIRTTCGHPGCQRKYFEKNEIYLSLEPFVWAQQFKAATPDERIRLQRIDALDLDTGFNPFRGAPLLGIPDYEKLYKDVNIEKYGRGDVYHLRCFEDLLLTREARLDAPYSFGPKNRKKQKTRGKNPQFIHPSPLRGVTRWLFPEDRYNPGGYNYLGEEAEAIVKMWKKAVYKEGIEKLHEKYPHLNLTEGDDDMEMDVDLSEETVKVIIQLVNEKGIGLAEVFHRFEALTSQASSSQER
jgi:hypothetical protein